MSALLARIARALSRHWGRGLIGLLLSIVAIGAIVGSQSGSAAEEFSIPGTESQKAVDLLQAKFPSVAGAESTIVFTSENGKLTDPQERETVENALECMKMDGTLAKLHEKWFGYAPKPGSAAATVFPGYGVPGMAGYDPTEHKPTCS